MKPEGIELHSCDSFAPSAAGMILQASHATSWHHPAEVSFWLLVALLLPGLVSVGILLVPNRAGAVGHCSENAPILVLPLF